MLAIFMQQVCSAAVIVWPGVTHAASGCAINATITKPATSCNALCNMSILPHVAKPELLTPRLLGY